MKEDEKKLEKVKEEIIDNLYTLQEEIEELSNFEFPDKESTLYNQVLDLIDETEASELLEELEIIVEKSQDIEKMIDIWLAKEGQNSLSLTWPTISS